MTRQVQILFHLGAHATDDGLLIRSVLKNRAALAERGIVVPGPGRYRDILREVTTELRGRTASHDTRDMVLETIAETDNADRLILSNENFICRPDMVLGTDALYPKAHKTAWLREVFPGHDTEFALGLRNPAALVPALLARIDASGRSHRERLSDIDLGALSWLDVVERIVASNPGCRLLVWCDEDTPFLWSEILREMTDAHDMTLTGGLDRVQGLLSEDAFERLSTILDRRAAGTEAEHRRLVAAFLDEHAPDDAVEEEIDVPGWDDDVVARLTEAYEDELDAIAAVPGVEFLEP